MFLIFIMGVSDDRFPFLNCISLEDPEQEKKAQNIFENFTFDILKIADELIWKCIWTRQMTCLYFWINVHLSSARIPYGDE